MMTDRRITLLLATAFALATSVMLAPARADEGPTAAKPADAAAKIHTAANLDVPTARLGNVPAPAVRMHRRKIAATARRPVSAPSSLVRIAYRPAAETTCGNGLCGAPIVLFIGITY
jgi:hypothetical protein